MRIAYLMLYTEHNYEEITENLDRILDAGDDVFVMINDDELRDEVFIAYTDEPRLHVSTVQSAALPADLSMPRGFICQMEDAMDFEARYEFEYDYFITMTDGMFPLISKQEMDAFLTSLDHKDLYYEVTNTNESEDLKKRMEDYAFFTNSFDFQKNRLIRGMNSMTAGIVRNFKKRELTDTIYLTYPWFVLTHESVEKLADNRAYCSSNFSMCLYPEEVCLGTMLKKFSPIEHINKDIWLVGKTGTYEFLNPIAPLPIEVYENNTDKIFGAKIHSDTNLSVYQNVFDIYCPIEDEE